VERHEVAAGVLVSGRRVLLCHRSPHRTWYPDVWDLPGGHVHVDETAPDALARELAEELGIETSPPSGPHLARLRAGDLELVVWSIFAWRGEVRNAAPEEHDALGWFEEAAFPDLDLAHPEYPGILSMALRGAGGGHEHGAGHG
jgi:8-oxo-dGTP pyrophosphatase MutT (NUDIX family)